MHRCRGGDVLVDVALRAQRRPGSGKRRGPGLGGCPKGSWRLAAMGISEELDGGPAVCSE
eukprot:12435951-Alexandrium_andersonii.AAC.1